ncbi:periplasmic chaperone for outer membrane proteins SurA [Taibaiella chishuiensis]|uniref:Periplasmic chaperone for outer membrane proteins SurA n=2 Tax=Taibaiella chishuiensis TaxID=1434707 RepID=A0A2P8D695_9BACT|nr:periplasmic chaperone for outer membrane proteins SurA [Taibaiella chishuiensis]
MMMAAFAPCFAQTQVADKIVGVVGNKIILQSDVNQQFQGEKQSNPNLPDSAKCTILYTMLAQQILVEQAGRDSVIVSDEEVTSNLDNRIRAWMQDAGGKERLEEASGRTIYQLKDDYREFFKDKLTAERMQGQLMKDVKITPQEVEAFFNKIPKDSLPPFPASVSVGQIVIKPKYDPEIEQLAKEKLEGIRKEIVENGKSFATMAGIYGMDGTKDMGGEMDINRKEFDQQFVAAAYRLQPGEISPVIKTKFGFHIIQMVRRMGEEAKVRHIVIVPEITNVDLQKTLKRLDSIRADLVSGKISFAEGVGKYSTDEQAKMTGGMVYDQMGNANLGIDQLDPDMARSVGDMKVGEYSQPQIYTDNPYTKTRSCRILYLKGRTDPHILNLKDDYSKIQQKALEFKQNEFLAKWISERISSYYIKIDPEYKDCVELKGWMPVAKNTSAQ